MTNENADDQAEAAAARGQIVMRFNDITRCMTMLALRIYIPIRINIHTVQESVISDHCYDLGAQRLLSDDARGYSSRALKTASMQNWHGHCKPASVTTRHQHKHVGVLPIAFILTFFEPPNGSKIYGARPQ